MDQEGFFLMVKMCGICSSHSKGSAKKCLLKKHNPCMTTVRYAGLTSAHRLCVKPDQSKTIYKLRDNETNEEFLEFDENITFQTSCDKCSNIKTCLAARHQLVDWHPSRIIGDGTAEVQVPIDPEPPMKKKNEAAEKMAKVKKNKKLKLKKERSDISTSASSSSTSGGGAGGMTSTSTVSDLAKASNLPWNGESAVSGVAAAEPAVPGRATCAVLTGVERSESGKCKGKIKVASGPAAGQQERVAQKNISSNKRKSTGPLSRGTGFPPAKANRVLSPRSSDSRQINTNSSVDTSNVDMGEDEVGKMPPKRRGKDKNPTMVTPLPITKCREASETADPVANDVAIEDDDGEPCTTGSTDSGGPSTVLTPPGEAAVASPPKTIAERLEAVKAEEADLLRRFEKTHKRCAKEEAQKRAEMEEFQRAGEKTLRVMRVAKEDALRKISDQGRSLREQRRELVQQRMKEFEAAEEAARAEALERDARLEAERKRLAHSCENTAQAAPVGGDDRAIDGYARLGFLAEETDKGPTAAAAGDVEAPRTTSSDCSAESTFPKAAEVAGATNHVNGVASENRYSTVFGGLRSCSGGKESVKERSGFGFARDGKNSPGNGVGGLSRVYNDAFSSRSGGERGGTEEKNCEVGVDVGGVQGVAAVTDFKSNTKSVTAR